MPDRRVGLRAAGRKLLLIGRMWWWFVWSAVQLRRKPLPLVASSVTARRPDQEPTGWPPRRTARAVDRALRIGWWRPRCLFRALVVLALVSADGWRAELVIGLPDEPEDKEAHAWVEIGGVDIGPMPGRGGHVELTRYG